MGTCRCKITMSAADRMLQIAESLLKDKVSLQRKLEVAEEYEPDAKRLKVENEELHQSADKKDKANRRLQTLCQRQTGLIVKLEGENKGLRNQLARKNGVILALVEMLQTSKAKGDRAEDERNRALALRNEWRRKYDDAREANENLQQQGQQQTEKTRKAEAKFAETEAKLDEKEAKLAVTEAKLVETKNELAETEAKLVETKNELESTQV